MFVCQRIKSGQAKPNDIKPCRPKTEVAPHDFAKVAHHYERSLAHTSSTPSMIKRRYEVCEKWPTKPKCLGARKKYTPTKKARNQNHIPGLRYTPSHVWMISKEQVRPQKRVVIDICTWSSDQRPSSGKNRAVKTSSKPRKQTVARQRSV